jgi:hypothetical protein
MAYNLGKEKSKKIFLFNKKSYEDFIFPYQTYINVQNFKDKDKIYYGFRNKNNLDIIPKADKVLFDDEYNIAALDFVIFAYKEMTEKYYSLLRDAQISSKSDINKTLSNPKISQVGLNFDPTLEKNKTEFNNKVITDQYLGLSTTNIKDYVNSYVLNIPLLKNPTQTHLKYLNSYKLKNINGLTINLLNKDFNNDQQKVDFMSDLNFPVLRKLAEQYGFYIDENAPWQLTANLSHPNIQSIVKKIYPEVNKADITPDFIISQYYDILLFIDYEKQKEFFYNAYIDLYNVSYKFTQAFYCSKKEKTNLNEVIRAEPPETLKDFLKTEELFFLNTYLKILNSERNSKYNIIQLNEISQQLSRLYRKDLDTHKALVYIYGKFETLVP